MRPPEALEFLRELEAHRNPPHRSGCTTSLRLPKHTCVALSEFLLRVCRRRLLHLKLLLQLLDPGKEIPYLVRPCIALLLLALQVASCPAQQPRRQQSPSLCR
jgi:hypothetical protein